MFDISLFLTNSLNPTLGIFFYIQKAEIPKVKPIKTKVQNRFFQWLDRACSFTVAQQFIW
jgi:hypothetical protein